MMPKSLVTSAAAAAIAASLSPATVDAAGAKLWYPDYTSSSYETGRCTDQPSVSLLKLANYASSGYEDRETCCRENFPGQLLTSYCSCMGGCPSRSDVARSDVNDVDIGFDMDLAFEKLMNESESFSLYQAEQEKYWSSLSSFISSVSSWPQEREELPSLLVLNS